MISNTRLIQRIEELSTQLNDVRRELLEKNRHLHGETWEMIRNNRARVDVGTKSLLMHMYRDYAANGQYFSFHDVAYSNYSQFGEDGVLEYIFELIGTTNKLVVEMCCGSATECNATNLILKHNWGGLLFDGSEKNIARGRSFFNKQITRFRQPRLINAWITRDNVNDLLKDNFLQGEIDLLSLDIDGNDYWLLKAIEAIDPRVIILEAHMMLGPDLECAVPYSDDFVVGTHEFEGDVVRMHSGASVRAYVKLCEQNGYRLVGKAGQFSPNIVFIKNGIGEQFFPAVDVEEVFKDLGSVLTERFRRVRETSFANLSGLMCLEPARSAIERYSERVLSFQHLIKRSRIQVC